MNLIKVTKSFKFAFSGLLYVMKHENNFKFHLISTLIINILAWKFHISSTDWCIIIACCGAVISTEIMNTAIEKTVDFISPSFHEQAGKIKDIAAASVLVTAIVSFIIGTLIFWKYT